MIVWVNVRITGQQNFMVTGFDYVCSQKGHLKSNNITICVLNSNAKCSNVTAPNQTWSLCIASARNFNPYLSGAPLRAPLCDLSDSWCFFHCKNCAHNGWGKWENGLNMRKLKNKMQTLWARFLQWKTP